MSLLRSLTLLYTFIFYNNAIPSGFPLSLMTLPFRAGYNIDGQHPTIEKEKYKL